MTNFLVRTFIKNHELVEEPKSAVPMGPWLV